MPAGHVYIWHLSDPAGHDPVVRLEDPVPPGEAALLTGQWWPPVMLSPSWVLAHHDEFDVFHIPAADQVESRWGRRPVVLPYPHVVEFDRIPAARPPRAEFAVGVHAKSLRASMAPLPVIQALAEVVPDLPGGRLQVNIHHDVFDPDGPRHDPELAGYLATAAGGGRIDLRVHDCLSDEELWRYLESLDATSLQAAVLDAYQRRPHWQGRPQDRRQERTEIAAAHQRLYEQLLG